MTPNSPWNDLAPGDARRVSSDGTFDFFWVVLDIGKIGLMLKLSRDHKRRPRLPKLKNLSMSYRAVTDGEALVIGLSDSSQMEIFETLCRDVVEAGEAGRNPGEALSRAVQRTHRWYHLLRGGGDRGLTVEEQRGLVGELAFLRDLSAGIGPEAAIEAWKGPTNSAKDFELIRCCIEIKTRRPGANPALGISSENQLADVDGGRLFLRAVNVASAVLPDGDSLHDHVSMTAKVFRQHGDALLSWENAIVATGYDPNNDYAERRWALGSVADYEVVDGFPRIVPPLAGGVGNVRYAVSLDACEPFKLSGDLLEAIQRGLKDERS